jgi:hypothetical protein
MVTVPLSWRLIATFRLVTDGEHPTVRCERVWRTLRQRGHCSYQELRAVR